MEKPTYCSRCGTLMIRKAQKELHGVKATIFTCPKCYYQYEKGIRYNRAIKQYFSYYKFS